MNENLNIETFITTAESPFSNVIVERCNLIVAEIMKKKLKDEKYELEIVLASDVSAKNPLQNHLRHSPNELVFAFNVNMSSILTGKLPALESATNCYMVRANLNTLYAARKSFMEAEASEKKIMRALQSNVKANLDEDFLTVDNVYCKRQNCKGWCGPVKVLGT